MSFFEKVRAYMSGWFIALGWFCIQDVADITFEDDAIVISRKLG